MALDLANAVMQIPIGELRTKFSGTALSAKLHLYPDGTGHITLYISQGKQSVYVQLTADEWMALEQMFAAGREGAEQHQARTQVSPKQPEGLPPVQERIAE